MTRQKTETTCGNCYHYIARRPDEAARCFYDGVCMLRGRAVSPKWDAAIAPCNSTYILSNSKKPTYWKAAEEPSDALKRWAGTFDGHVVLTAAERYAWDRHTGGSEMTLEAITRLIPYAGENTAAVIVRDIEGPCGDEPDLGEMSKEQRGLFIACKERLGEADGLR